MKRYLIDYAVGKKKEDMTLAAVLAVNACEEGDTLCLGGGELHFYPDDAYEKFYYISNNDCGVKKIAFPLIHKKSLTIDGEGASLIFHGKILPFAVEKCQDIVIKNLSIDYAEPMYFEAKITESGTDFVEMEYDPSHFHVEAKEHRLVFSGKNWEISVKKVLVNEFDEACKGPTSDTPTYFAFVGEPEPEPPHYASLYRFVKASKPADDRLRLEGNIGYCHTVGKHWLCSFDDRECPGIFVSDSKNIKITDTILYYTPSMGVICQLSENIILQRVTAVPQTGRLLSTNADATHFVNCSGLIRMQDCRFESMMDDAANIHGIYIPVSKKLNEHQVLLRFGHHQQRGINIFKTGDKVRLADNQTLQPYAEYEVTDSRLVNAEYLLLKTKEKLPQSIREGHVFENYSRMPEVHIKGCRSGYNRPRGFLLSTCKDVLVEECEFYNLEHAIAIMGDANSWFESGSCGRIELKNNHFECAAYAGTSIIEGNPVIRQESAEKYHGSLILRDNYFRRDEPRNIHVHSFKEVVSENDHYIEADENGRE